ncbi:hypothetical protein DERF_014971 [Dermatophagoides farinae]|uniref:Transmembrane protein n=1 Tax=Dermatophagoides farinae TaxID=6954 RepID=A0A922KVF6_DERFA|nr:hypothetical protein DERF_014971 [Dermatophagoides farinae]
MMMMMINVVITTILTPQIFWFQQQQQQNRDYHQDKFDKIHLFNFTHTSLYDDNYNQFILKKFIIVKQFYISSSCVFLPLIYVHIFIYKIDLREHMANCLLINYYYLFCTYDDLSSLMLQCIILKENVYIEVKSLDSTY